MNRRTFSDAVASRVSSLANDIEDDQDERDDEQIKAFRGNVEGEEEDGDTKYDEEDGTTIEPFNLKSDRESGYFDENMNFVFHKEKSEVDSWLANMDESEMEKAIGEAAAALKKQNAKQEALDQIYEQTKKKSLVELKTELLVLLHPNETVAGAMRRLSGRGTETSYTGNKRRRPPSSMKISTGDTIEVSQTNKLTLDKLTDIANELLTRGMTSIFQMSYESIDASLSQWEYKGQDGTIHGPYSSQQIAAWKSQGYFTGATAVLMRKVINQTNSSNDLVDDIMSDEEDNKGKDNNKDNKSPHISHVTDHSDSGSRWILSDDIDFGDPNDLPPPSNNSNNNSNNSNDSRDRMNSTRNGLNQRRVNFRNEQDEDEENDDDEDPEVDGRVNRRSRRKGLKEEEDDDEEND